MASNKINVGGSVTMWKVSRVAHVFGMKMPGCIAMLRHLKVPTIHVGQDAFVLVTALEEALYTMGELGGPGFMAPASKRKHQAQSVKINPAKELDPKLLDPAVRSRRHAAMNRAAKSRMSSMQQQVKNFLQNKTDEQT